MTATRARTGGTARKPATSAGRAPVALRRFPWGLGDPIRGRDGKVIEALTVRPISLADLEVLGVEPLVDSAGRVDLPRARRWAARIAEIDEAVASRITDADLENVAGYLDSLADLPREAVRPGPWSVRFILDEPLSGPRGRTISELLVRPPIPDDFAVLGWPSFIGVRRDLVGGMELAFEWRDVGLWIERLAGLDDERVRQLCPVDALQLVSGIEDACRLFEQHYRAPS